MGCEAACFTDCSTKYKAEVMDEDAFLQTSTPDELAKEFETCMAGSKQCEVAKLPNGTKAFKADANFTRSRVRSRQMVAGSACFLQMKKNMKAKKHADKHEKHVKKMLRHSKQLTKMSLLQEDRDPTGYDMVQPYYIDHGAFSGGSLKLIECVDLCLSVHCPCPDPLDGSHFMTRYPAISESAAQAAGVPTQADAQAQADAGAGTLQAKLDEKAQQAAEIQPSPMPSPSPSPGPSPSSGEEDCHACCENPGPETCHTREFHEGCMANMCGLTAADCGPCCANPQRHTCLAPGFYEFCEGTGQCSQGSCEACCVDPGPGTCGSMEFYEGCIMDGACGPLKF